MQETTPSASQYISPGFDVAEARYTYTHTELHFIDHFKRQNQRWERQ